MKNGHIMAENEQPPSDSPVPQVASDARPEELPPVEPPSAGFIVQLFFVPALIVAAVIGVWALFGKMADSETDWAQLVAELSSGNEHRRWRAANGLAQVLNNQQIAAVTDGEVLAQKPEVAQALCDLLEETLQSPSTLPEDVEHRKFLARTLGTLQCNEIVLPTLEKTLSADRDPDVRKSGLMALNYIAERAFQEQAKAAGVKEQTVAGNNDVVINLAAPFETPTIDSEGIFAQLKEAMRDEEPNIRQLAAFAFSRVSGPDSMRMLKLMLLDGDSFTRANAAVGLARNGDISGGDALVELVEEFIDEVTVEDIADLEGAELKKEMSNRILERENVLRNCFRAIGGVYPQMSAEQRDKLKPLVESAAGSGDAKVAVEAASLQKRISDVEQAEAAQ